MNGAPVEENEVSEFVEKFVVEEVVEEVEED